MIEGRCEVSGNVCSLAKACADCGSGSFLFSAVMFCEGCGYYCALGCDSKFVLTLCLEHCVNNAAHTLRIVYKR